MFYLDVLEDGGRHFTLMRVIVILRWHFVLDKLFNLQVKKYRKGLRNDLDFLEPGSSKKKSQGQASNKLQNKK